MLELTHEKYFSKEADIEYMSVSQYKNFCECEAKALNDLQSDSQENKEAFLEGHLFEELVAGDAKLFMAQHNTELIAKTGPTKGQLKSNFKKILKSADRFKEQKLFMDEIEKSEKQVILTGNIEGVPVKCCLDLLNIKENKILDIKCMKDFSEQWSKKDKKYIPWYYAWGYVLQLAVYKEIAEQNYSIPFETYLIAASKEDEPDVAGLHIHSDLLDVELQEFKEKVVRYNDIKLGKIIPNRCEKCSYCKRTKILKDWEFIDYLGRRES